MPTVLLVEDNEWNRDMLSRRLCRRDWQVTVATDGPHALRTIAETPCDVILMDMSMPGMDGWQTTRRLKADAATRGIPVIALTAHAMQGDRERALEAGCDAFETKPVHLESLLSTMHDLALRRCA